jgi:serine protease AprX
VDSGIDAQHPDFEGRLVEYTDFIGNGDAPSDPNGHGTHVAGIAAGSGAASGGRLKGVAPDAGLVVARVLDGSGGGRTSGVMAGIEWAIEQGAQVINLSLGGPPFPSDGTDALSLLCDAAWQQGVVVCVAAGNLGPSRQTIGSPGAARNVITVAATNGRASGDSVADFSSRGPTGDGRLKPDLCMPGVDVVAPRARGTVLGQPVDEHYTSLRGTSQATPMVSGAAALLLQANPRLKPDDIKQRMVQGAVRLAGLEAVVQGAGRGDAFNALVGEAGVPEGTPELPQPIVPQPPRPEQQVGCLAAPVALLARRADK